MKVCINYGEYDEYFKKHWFAYDYYKVKNYLLENSINNSYPELVSRTNNDCYICLVDNIVLDVEFLDDELKIVIHQLYRMIDEYGSMPTLVTMPEEEHDDVVRMIDGLALNRVTEIY